MRFEEPAAIEKLGVRTSSAVNRGIAALEPAPIPSTCFDGLKAKFLAAKATKIESVYSRPSAPVEDLERSARAPSPEPAVSVESSSAKKVVLKSNSAVVQKSDAASNLERGSGARRSSSVGRTGAAASSVSTSADEVTERRAVLARPSGIAPTSEVEAPVNLGSLVAVLSSVQAQQEAVRMIQSAGRDSVVLLTAYTLDRQDLVEAMIACRERGADVRAVLDRQATVAGRTRGQLSCGLQLAAAGVQVRVVSGALIVDEYAAVGRRVASHLKGIQHSKTVAVKTTAAVRALIGSVNWTTSSRANHEAAAVVEVNGAAKDAVFDLLQAPWIEGVPLAEAQRQEEQRSRSVSPSRCR